MSELTFTHKDLAIKLGVSETTIKSYRRKFPGCFPVASKGKPIRFKQEAEAVAFKIKALFSTGMSIEEVRERLGEEFSWWKPKDNSQQKKESARLKSDLPQNFATAISNMAKSMISLSQQQAGILASMQRIENMLKEIGLSGFNVDEGAIAESRASRDAAVKESQREISAINVRLHSLTQSLAEERAATAEERVLFTNALEKVVQMIQSKTAASGQKAEILHFPQSENNKSVTDFIYENQTAPEFPRHILSLPLVVRTEDGAYLSAGGKSIGRISLNDLKAILAQTYMPPENFSMSWDYKAEGWWVYFIQRGIPEPMEADSIAILVAEISSSKGVGVLEARKYFYNDKEYPAAELIRFVTGVGKD